MALLQYCKKGKVAPGTCKHFGDPESADMDDQPGGEGEPAPKRQKSTMQQSSSKGLSASEKKEYYKGRLSYRKEWEQTYPWVHCTDPKEGMFCSLYQKLGKPSATARGGWVSRGITDWNHATEQLKSHNSSKSHQDAAIAARMAEQSASRGRKCSL